MLCRGYKIVWSYDIEGVSQSVSVLCDDLLHEGKFIAIPKKDRDDYCKWYRPVGSNTQDY